MKVLYYDCFSGISGDMHLGAMIDLGVPPDYLAGNLKKLNIAGYEIKIARDKRKGITGTKVDVVTDPAREQHHGRGHHGRTHGDIVALIKKSALPDKVKKVSLDIFARIAEAEGKIHGVKTDSVHFHEIGAVDSIIDIVGAAICLDYIGPERVISSPVQLGGGFVKCAHGILPVPAPATLEILRNIPVKSGAVPFETTTPTGAAIIAATADSFTEEICFTIEKIGYGIGHRDTDIPNVLRICSAEMDAEDARSLSGDADRQTAIILECNIDDMNPELYGDLMEALLAKGAQDVFLTPIIMKKSRPAIKISVLCDEKTRAGIEEVFWLGTTTFGLRFYRVFKTMLKRDFSELKTGFGSVSVKNGYWRGRKIKSKIEYGDCLKLAREKGVGVKEIYDLLNFPGNIPADQTAGKKGKTVRKK